MFPFASTDLIFLKRTENTFHVAISLATAEKIIVWLFCIVMAAIH